MRVQKERGGIKKKIAPKEREEVILAIFYEVEKNSKFKEDFYLKNYIIEMYFLVRNGLRRVNHVNNNDQPHHQHNEGYGDTLIEIVAKTARLSLLCSTAAMLPACMW